MKILTKVKTHLRIVGAFRMPSESILLNHIHITFVVMCLLSYITSVFTFLLSSKAKTFADYAEAILFCSITFSRIFHYGLLISKRAELTDLMEQFEDIIQTRSRLADFGEIYRVLIADSERFIRTFWKYFSSSLFFTAGLRVFESYYRYYKLHQSHKSFKPLLPTSFPWNWKTPSGYLVAVSIQFYWLYGGLFVAMTISMTFAGFCMLFGVFVADMKKQLADFNRFVVSVHQHFTPSNRIEIKKKFLEIVQFHQAANELKDRLTILFRLLLTVFFALTMTSMSSALLSLNEAVDRRSTVDMVRLLVFLTYVLIYIGFLCFFGDVLTRRFEEVNDSICKCAWNEFPPEVQKMLPFFVMGAQKPIYIHGFMNVQCTREAFKNIMSASFSYFSVLRGASH